MHLNAIGGEIRYFIVIQFLMVPVKFTSDIIKIKIIFIAKSFTVNRLCCNQF